MLPEGSMRRRTLRCGTVAVAVLPLAGLGWVACWPAALPGLPAALPPSGTAPAACASSCAWVCFDGDTGKYDSSWTWTVWFIMSAAIWTCSAYSMPMKRFGKPSHWCQHCQGGTGRLRQGTAAKLAETNWASAQQRGQCGRACAGGQRGASW